MKTETKSTKPTSATINAGDRNIDIEYRFYHQWADNRPNTLVIDLDTDELFLTELPGQCGDRTKPERLQAVTVKAALLWFAESWQLLRDDDGLDSEGTNERLCELAAKQL